MSIRHLPDSVADRITSSAAITSLNAVVCGLLKNSLDASSTKVNIYLDYIRGNCSVEDDGLGIEPLEFREAGGLGKHHHSSRDPSDPASHGLRGDFLACLANLSLLSIASHHHRHVSQSFFSVHNSRLIARNIPALPEQRLANFNHGTRVSVRALFASLPVRVKYHAKIFADRATVDREWRNLIDEVVALLLAWPSSVSVYINELGSRRELRLHPGSDTDPGPRTSRLFTQASLADSADGPSWLPVSASSLHFRVEGCISTRPAVKRRSQMMSLGIWPILNSGSASVLFDEINTIFSCSDFAISPDENSQERKSKRGLKSKPRKGIDRWPMFYLRILPHNSTPLVVNHVLDAGSREFSCILDILRAVCTSFLKKLSLRPRSTGPARVPAARVLREAKKNATSRPSLCLATQPLTSRHALPRSLPGRTRRESPFDDWHQLKIGFPSLPPPGKQVGHGAWRQGGRPAEPVNRFVGEDGELLGKPFEEDQCADYSGRPNGSVSVVPAKRPAVHLDGEPAEAPGEWLRKILSSWENPVFETAEAPIPQICGHAGDLGRGAPHRPRPSPWTVNFEAASLAMVGRLSKAALARAVVIAQLDCKFILVKMPLQSPADGAAASSALVVVDQHAADERCRLEDLMAAYFTRDPASDCLRPVVEPLEHPLVFELSGCEGELLGRYRPQLASWGILYHLEADGPPTSRPAAAGSDPGCRATVTSLPPSILERCRAEPRLLIDLVRTHLWALDEARLSNAFPPSSSADETSWLPRFHGCPTGILHLLHSRSCRSAIMFNDELSRDQCELLIKRLSQCVFPFQCAHGRPSMVPLADLGWGPRLGREWDNQGHGRAEKWKAWLGKGAL